jgi:hypothetical protein
MDVDGRVTQEQLPGNSDEAICKPLIANHEIAALAAPDILSFRGTCTSLYIALAMTGNC